MEINQIKQQLSIYQVLTHYGLTIQQKHINCPFHKDKTPSMRVYGDTNSVYCFSGNCKQGGKVPGYPKVVEVSLKIPKQHYQQYHLNHRK